ncbi:MAG: helix-turn-helix domain-containing protein, partial [Microcystis sp.]
TVETVEPISTIETVASAIEKTQSEIARLLGVHSSTVTRWKQNKAIPSEYSDKCRFNGDKTKILWIYDRI